MNKKIKNWDDIERVDENGDPYTPECNTGNIFECGLPRIEFFGGGGEGAVGDVILGNFIEELDKSISETEVVVDGETQPVGSILEDVKVTGTADGINVELEKANRVADFLELGELMARDALNREESAGGHFREESQTEENEEKW